MVKAEKISSEEAAKKFDTLKYHVLPGRFRPGFAGADQYNMIYRYWTGFWDKVMSDLETPERIDPYEFLRSDFVTAITSGSEIVAVHLYSALNLEQACIASHPYFKGEQEERFLLALRARDIRTVLTLEYLTVNPEWRKSKTGFSLAPVVVGLGYKIQNMLQIDSSLGRCRKDSGVDRLMTDVGGEAIFENVTMYNTLVDFCHVHRDHMRPHPDALVQARIDSLWRGRIDWTSETKPQIEIQRIAV